MKKIIIFLFLVGIAIQAKSQGSFTTWYEYGNGNFFYNSGYTTATVTTWNNALPPNATGGTLLGIKKITPIYTPPQPPARLFTYRTPNPPSSGATTTLTSGQNINYITNTPDFISKDTLMIAVLFKKDLSSIQKVAFFYNKSANTTSSFNTISSPTASYNLLNESGSASRSIRHIRIANAAITSSVVNSGSSPLFETGKPGNGWKDGVVFSVNTLATSASTQHNLFLSLITPAFIPNSNTESFKVVFLDGNDNPVGNNIDPRNIINNAGLASHDPNCEIVEPKCVLYPTDAGKILRYKVKFQNTGLGQADYVKTITNLPPGYTIADITNYNSIYWRIGDGSTTSNYSFSSALSNNEQLILEFQKTPSMASAMVLAGATGDDPINNIQTMGSFSFDLKLKTPLTGPEDLISYTNIYFDTNAAVKTNEAIVKVRQCCDCPQTQNEGINNTNAQNPNECKPCKRWRNKKWLRWLFCEDC
jgi:hypothetical protein